MTSVKGTKIAGTLYFVFRLSPAQLADRPLLGFFESEVPTFYPVNESLARAADVVTWVDKVLSKDEIEDIGRDTLMRVRIWTRICSML